MAFFFLGILINIAAIGLLFVLLQQLYEVLVGKPRRLGAAVKKQGIYGPPPRILIGNLWEMKRAMDLARKSVKAAKCIGAPELHQCGPAVLPFLHLWRRQYGEMFVFWIGTTPILHVTKTDVVKEITTCTSLDFGKPTYQVKTMGSLLGNGIITSNGSIWVHQRKVLAPQLYADKVKGMTNLIQESAMKLVDTWKERIEKDGCAADISIDQHLRSFSGDVISRACFGSNYSKGEQIFFRLRALQGILSNRLLGREIPGTRYLPNKSNRQAWALAKEIKMLILKVVKERTEVGYEDDLLQMILEGAQDSIDYHLKSQEEIDRFIVDNCKNIYLAGYETTAVTASWCFMLLAANPEWQERVRQESLQICQGQLPDVEMIRKMRELTMVIYEALRLYPPVPVISREAFDNIKLGNINVPKGVNVWTSVTMLHTDPDIWGPDSYTFNPERFVNGIAGACKEPHVYMPFGVGPRVCLGQNLALAELKILISLIVCNFRFTMAPTYIHSPTQNLVIEPFHGVNLLVDKIC